MYIISPLIEPKKERFTKKKKTIYRKRKKKCCFDCSKKNYNKKNITFYQILTFLLKF